MKYFFGLLLLPVLAQATSVFDGYEEYYSSLPNPLFPRQGIALEAFSREGENDVRFGWKGEVGGNHHNVEVRKGQLKIDGWVLPAKSVKAFPGEVVNPGDLGRGSIAYFAADWACVENTPSSASGSAVRHKSVYLVSLTKAKPQAWKLPSLFASCQGIRSHRGQIRFDKVEYRYISGKDESVGVVFNEYAIQSGRFVPLAGKQEATFVEADNVYKFSINP